MLPLEQSHPNMLINSCFPSVQVIQADFVERRQKSIGGEGITQEDLLFRMTVAR